MALVYRENQDLIEGLKSALSQDVPELDILVLDLCDSEGTRRLTEQAKELDSRVRVIAGAKDNLAQANNAAIANAKGKYVVNLSPNIRFYPGMLGKMRQILEENENFAFSYSNFENLVGDEKKPKQMLEDIQDDTENADFGHVKMYRKAYVEEVGGYDESYNSAEEYELRLRLTDKYLLGFVDEVLYGCIQTQGEGKVAVGASELFFPGEGEYGGFAYLFYEKEAEREIETAFKNMLKRRGLYMTHENVKVPYAPDEKFSPLVSVVIPCRNRGKFIGRCIQSALDQTFDDYEIIVVDNGSTDNTVEEAKKFEGDKVRVIETGRSDGTISFALNTGVKASKAKYISQLDSDDIYDKKTIENMVFHMENNPKAGLGISYYDLIDIEDNVLEKFGVIKHLEYDRNNILRVNGAGALRMWHRRVLEEFGFFNEGDFANYGEDYHMVLQVSEKYNVGRVQHICYHYRRHSDNTDAVRDPLANIRLKTKARKLCYERRKKINQSLGAAK